MEKSLLDLLSEDGIETKLVASTNGGEYASPCPECGGEDRFRVWPNGEKGGRYWCRVCNKAGDVVRYLQDFRGMSLKEAFIFSGVDPRARAIQRQHAPKWEPAESRYPSEFWMNRATDFLNKSTNHLHSEEGEQARSWLEARGITVDTMVDCRLGFNPSSTWQERSDWGLPEELNDAGRPKKLWLPGGLVIPTFVGDRIIRLRIRRFDEEPKYIVVSGSSMTTAMMLGKMGGTAPGKTIGFLNFDRGSLYFHYDCRPHYPVVVESELDAILLVQHAGDMCVAMALGTAAARPDTALTELLKRTHCILISLDADEAGSKNSKWWKQHFGNAKRWPIPTSYGKDPGEAVQNGLDLRTWVYAGFRKSFEEAKRCRMEAFSLYS